MRTSSGQENTAHRRVLQPELQDDGDDRQFATPVTPYQRGFDNATYCSIYLNVFDVGSAEWRCYDEGFMDATALRQQKRRALP